MPELTRTASSPSRKVLIAHSHRLTPVTVLFQWIVDKRQLDKSSQVIWTESELWCYRTFLRFSAPLRLSGAFRLTEHLFFNLHSDVVDWDMDTKLTPYSY